MNDAYEVVIVGGGPAGLSAALVLGRSRRHVLLCDEGETRNQASKAIHALLGQEGIAPSELTEQGRRELRAYDTVVIRKIGVSAVTQKYAQFTVACSDGKIVTGRKLLLATGIVDEMPDIAGVKRFYGRSVHHCPYCNGFEHRDKPLAVYGPGDKSATLALMLKQWSKDVLICADASDQISTAMRAKLQKHEIPICSEKVECLIGTDHGSLTGIKLKNGEVLKRSALFFSTGSRQRSDLWASLGCARDDKGGIIIDPVTEESSVPGVFVAGDASRDVLLVSVAIAEGTKAGVAINRALLKDDCLV